MFNSCDASGYFWKDTECKTAAYHNYSYTSLSPSILSWDEGEGGQRRVHECFSAPTDWSRGRSISWDVDSFSIAVFQWTFYDSSHNPFNPDYLWISSLFFLPGNIKDHVEVSENQLKEPESISTLENTNCIIGKLRRKTIRLSRDFNNHLCIFSANRCTFWDNTYPERLQFIMQYF